MKKTFPAVLLALASVATIIVVIHNPASGTSVASSSVLKPIAEKSVPAQMPIRAVHARTSLQENIAPAPKRGIDGALAADRAIQPPPAQPNSRKQIAATLVSVPTVFEPSANGDRNRTQFVGHASGMDIALTSKGIIVRVSPTDNADAAPDMLGIQVRGAGPLEWRGEDKAQGETNYFVGNDPQKWRTRVSRFKRVETANSGGLGLAVYGSANNRKTSESQGIEYDVRLDRAVDPAKVRLNLSGARDVRIDHEGDLAMRVGGRQLRMKAPAIYEQISRFHAGAQRRKMTTSLRPRKTTPRISRGTKSPRESGRRIDGGYILEADGSIGFWVGRHDPNAALVIDPSITLAYASFLGGTGADSVNSMAIDASGNVYVAGMTTSGASFPEAAGGTEGNIRGAAQLFLAKVAFSPTGVGSLQYVTLFGGSNAQAGGEVAVDANGNTAVLGTTTSADYPVTDGRAPTQGLTGGTGNDLVVSEVDATGSNLIFSTIFGGNGTESANATGGTPLTSSLNIPAGQGGIAFDAAGNVYVASDTTSTDLPMPTTGEAYQPAFGGKESDGFIAEFQTQNVPEGANDLLYCSYLGTNSDGPVAIGGIAVDSATPPGVYIAGSTNNAVDGFPAEYAFQSQYEGGSSDAFLMKMQLAGTGASDLLYSTLLGGSGTDEALGITIDSQGSAYVVGATQSLTFPDIPAPTIAGPSMKLYQPIPSPPPGVPPIQNAFLAVVGWNSGQTVSLEYFTYLGGSGQDAAESVAAPSPGNVYVSGTTTSYNFGWHDNLQPFNGSADAFLAKLNTTQPGAASLLYATPLGGTFLTPGVGVTTFGNGVAADARGDVYVAGQTTATNFPTTMTNGNAVNGFQQICESCQEQPAQGDAFIAGIREGTAAQPAVSFGSPNVNFGAAGVQIGTEADPPQVFAITNTGETNLNFSATEPLTVTGANSGDFPILASGCAQFLAPGQNCQVKLGFVPSAAGAEGALVSIADDAPGSPQPLEVTGLGVGPLTTSPASFAFGTVPLGETPTKHDIKVSITAGLDVSNFSFTLSGPDTAQFAWAPLGTPCPSGSGIALTTGTSCDIWYAFAPSTTGSFRAELDVTGDINSVPITEKLPLTGTAVAAIPIAVVLPSQLIFRNEPLASAETLPVFISNTGTAPLVLTRPLAFSGPSASEFSEADDCPDSIPPRGQRTPPNSWCTVNVSFTPQTPGDKTANLVIGDNVPGTPQLVALAGTAVSPAVLQVTPSNWDFGSQNFGTQGSPETFTIANTGNTSLNFTQAIGIAGSNAADFQQTDNCPISVAPGSSCNISVMFSPQSAGARSASIDIANNAPGSPQSVPLTGTGVLLPQTQLTPASLTFGSQVMGTLSAPQAVSVKNTGSAPLVFTQIAFAGANSGDFIETDNCLGNEIAPNLSCTIFVRFSPQSVGSKMAIVSISDNASSTPQTVTVSGTAAAAATIQVTPATLNFAIPQSVGTTSAPQAVTLVNQGTIPITFTQGASSIAIGGVDPSDFSETGNCSVQSGLQSNSTCTVNVVFAPMSGGTRNATLSIADSAPGSPQTVALSGAGVQANAQVAPTALSFGGQTVGTGGAAQTITVASVGPGQPLNVNKVSFSGVNAADFAESDNCGGPITATCEINVTFTPVCANEPASRSATLTILDNGSVPSQTVSLTGTATGGFCVSASVDSLIETVAEGTTAVFPPSAAPPLSIISIGSFSGTVNLACSSNPAGPMCTFSPTAAIAVSPNLPAQFEVQAATIGSASAGFVRPEAGNWGMRLLWLATGLIGLLAAVSVCVAIRFSVRARVQPCRKRRKSGAALQGAEKFSGVLWRDFQPRRKCRPMSGALAPGVPLLPFSATCLVAEGIFLRLRHRLVRKSSRKAYRPVLAGAILAAVCLALVACGGGGGTGANASSNPPPPLAGAYTLTVTANDGGETHTLTLHLSVTP